MWRKILRVLGYSILMIMFIICAVYVLVSVDPYQHAKASKLNNVKDLNFIEAMLSPEAMDSLAQIYGGNKSIPTELRSAALLALSYYPELKDHSITFHYEPAMIPLSSRPAPWGIFQHANERNYHIYVSSESNEAMESILIHNLPPASQVAILAHELGHTLFYTRLTGLQVAKFALVYAVDTEARASHEKGTDSLVVYRGLGPELLEYANYVRYESDLKNSYVEDKGFSDEFYLKPDAIEALMRE